MLNSKMFFMVLFFLLSTTSFVWAEGITSLETMTVTANKAEENVQDVSASITVFNNDMVKDLNIESLSDVAAFTPNFYFYEPGVSGMSIPSVRGIYADLHSHTVPVGMYIDGVPVLDGMGYVSEILDIERIEILKGPQGTLYGKSTEGGVINIITRKPDNKFSGNVAQSLGTDNEQKTKFSLYTPIAKDKVYFSLSGIHYQKDGWIERVGTSETVDDISYDYSSAKLRFIPSSNLEIIWNGTYSKRDDEQPHQVTTAAAAKTNYGIESYYGDRTTDPSFIGNNNTKITTHSLVLNLRINPDLELVSTTAYRKVDLKFNTDWDFYQVEGMHYDYNADVSSLSQEVRLNGNWKSSKWVLGVYGDKEENDMLSLYNGVALPKEKIKGDSKSIFAHIKTPIDTKISVLGGFRYDVQDKTYDSAKQNISLEDDWSEVSPKIGAEYKISDTQKLYSTISKGYLSGGFNAYVQQYNMPEYLTYEEETLWSYEIGTKNTFLDNRFIINGAIFYMDIDNAHVMQTIPGSNGSASYTKNAAKATSQGFELEFTAIPVERLKIFAGLGYTDAEFDEYVDDKGISYKGKKKPFSSEYTFNTGFQYRTLKGFYYSANLTGYGDMYTDDANTLKSDPYQLVDAKIGYETEKYDIYLYGRNIFDEKHDVVAYTGYVACSEPATFGVQAEYRF